MKREQCPNPHAETEHGHYREQAEEVVDALIKLGFAIVYLNTGNGRYRGVYSDNELSIGERGSSFWISDHPQRRGKEIPEREDFIRALVLCMSNGCKLRDAGRP